MNRYRKYIAKVAKEEGVSFQEVYDDMQEAITAAFHDPDPEVQAFWRELIKSGKKPTPEDVIAYCVKEIKKAEQ